MISANRFLSVRPIGITLLALSILLGLHTLPLHAQSAITLPSDWTADGPITLDMVEQAMPPFTVLSAEGDLLIERAATDAGDSYRVYAWLQEGKPPAPRYAVDLAWTATGEDAALLAGQVVTVTLDVRAYSPPDGVRLYLAESSQPPEDGAWASSGLTLDGVTWQRVNLTRQVAADAQAVRVGFDWTLPFETAWLEFRNLTVSAGPAAEFSGTLAPTETPTPVATPTPDTPPTPTPTLTPLVVTSTPTAPSVLAAATLAAQATAAAEAAGTATPTPANMVTATFTPLPTETPTPIVVTNTPTPANPATATMVALEAQARAFTTGTPTPFPADATVLTATPTNTPGPQGRPTNTPTPFFVLLEDIPPTNTPAPTPTFPAALVGKIVFKANLFGNDRRPDYLIMNPDGSGVGRMTGAFWYNRAAEREHYSGDRRFYASVSREQDGFRRIQIFYDFIEFGTRNQLTFFGAGTAWDPAWSPVEETVVLVSNESKNDEIWIVRRDEWPAVKLTNNDWEWDNHPSFSPDGGSIVFMSNRNSGQRQLWIMDADGGNQRQLTNFPFEAWDPVWIKYPDS